MSGVIGLVNFPSDRLDRLEAHITERLCRFQWNTWDWWTSADHRIGLGRVDIGVFNAQPQPAVDPDGQVVVLFSGELYRTEGL